MLDAWGPHCEDGEDGGRLFGVVREHDPGGESSWGGGREGQRKGALEFLGQDGRRREASVFEITHAKVSPLADLPGGEAPSERARDVPHGESRVDLDDGFDDVTSVFGAMDEHVDAGRTFVPEQGKLVCDVLGDPTEAAVELLVLLC